MDVQSLLKIQEDKCEIFLVDPKAEREMLLDNLGKLPGLNLRLLVLLITLIYNIGCFWFYQNSELREADYDVH